MGKVFQVLVLTTLQKLKGKHERNDDTIVQTQMLMCG